MGDEVHLGSPGDGPHAGDRVRDLFRLHPVVAVRVGERDREDAPPRHRETCREARAAAPLEGARSPGLGGVDDGSVDEEDRRELVVRPVPALRRVEEEAGGRRLGVPVEARLYVLERAAALGREGLLREEARAVLDELDPLPVARARDEERLEDEVARAARGADEGAEERDDQQSDLLHGYLPLAAGAIP